MSGDDDFIALIDSIYETIHDRDVWPKVLTTLADAMDASQVAITSVDKRDSIVSAVAPRTDPALVSLYKEYWAFNCPLWRHTALQPVGRPFSLDSLMRREEFSATPIFNEWWRRAEYGLAATAANLIMEDNLSALICVTNAPAIDQMTERQTQLFATALRHIIRAIKIRGRLWGLELNKTAALERLDTLQKSAFLVDARARVVFLNSTAKAMLDAEDGIVLRKGRLTNIGDSDTLQTLIASCVEASLKYKAPGGEFSVERAFPCSPLQVSVAPLRSTQRLSEVSWLGLSAPVAIVTVNDPDCERRQLETNLQRRFGLTAAESRLAAEIVKGDGRGAAARRRGITGATARTHLSSIFEKTGTHRQAELVRLLLDVSEARKLGSEPFGPYRG